MKILKSRSKKWKEPYKKTLKICGFSIYNLSIFEIQYIKTVKLTETGCRTQGIFLCWSFMCNCIFEIQYKKTKKLKGTGCKIQYILEVLLIFLTSLKALKAQYHVDLWIFQNMKIKVQKVKGTVRKMLWICGFSIYTYLIVLLV